MAMQSLPLVSVVTPVYNGEKYLSECVDSVLSQTYENWEYVIVNNCSTDSTLEIASKYAEKDSRIRVINNDKFLGMIQNWNHALRQISPLSAYCKVLHSDDYLFEDCIEKMVKVGEAYGGVKIIGSYRLEGNKVSCVGLRYPDTVISGREICRASFLGELDIFVSPTVYLIRSDIIREKKPFYNEQLLHADTEVCYDVLQHSDFGFVHQVLSYTRRHNESCTETFSKKVNSNIIEHLGMLLSYGRAFFNEDEYQMLVSRRLKKYYRYLARSLFRGKGNAFWAYHKAGLEKLGLSLSYCKLALSLPLELASAMLNLQYTFERIQSLRQKNNRLPSAFH